MQTTTFDPNFSIFDKKFVPVCTQSIDMEPLEGDQFWPTQHKSPNKLKKIISKTFKSLKRKVLRKPRKVSLIKETMVSEITSFTTYENIIEIDEIVEIIDIYLSIPESYPDKDEFDSSNIVEYEASSTSTLVENDAIDHFENDFYIYSSIPELYPDKDEFNSYNIVEYEASSSCTLAENDAIDHFENDFNKCNPIETNYIPYESVNRTIKLPCNISDCELKTLIELKIIYPLTDDPVF
ncbi:10502_t:CDS:1, partial [Funneliformis mosseae]